MTPTSCEGFPYHADPADGMIVLWPNMIHVNITPHTEDVAVKKLLICAVVGCMGLAGCDNPFSNIAKVPGMTTVTAKVDGVSFNCTSASCVVQPAVSGTDVMTLSASTTSASPKTITMNIVVASGRSTPFDVTLPATDCVAAYTLDDSQSWSTNNAGGSGTVHITHWSSNSDGTGYAEGTFTLTVTDANGGNAKSITNGTIKKN